jgi:type 1 glutamine amidotransferase
MIKKIAISLALAAFVFNAASFAADAPKRRVLFFSKSSGFEHSVIKVKDGQPSYADKVLMELGAKNNIEFTCTKNGAVFTPEGLAQFDAVFFYTTGDLTQPGNDKQPPMPANGKETLLNYIKSGNGFIGSHCATDTFHSKGGQVDPYIDMIGGEFLSHGAQQKSKISCADADFPGCRECRNGFELHEEWYSLKNIAKDLHVLLVQNTDGMTGWMYQRPAYPSTWTKAYGKGRVFYTSMGHREDVWTNPVFQNMVVNGIKFACRDISANTVPTVEKVTPEAWTVPTAPPKNDKKK